jgi:hypothetical protein
MARLAEALPSIAVAPEREKRALSERTRREREWYSRYKRYETNADILRAEKIGELVLVHEDVNIMPIARLRNRELNESFPPYLLPYSRHVLNVIGRLWRTELNDLPGRNHDFRLAVTSLARSLEMQAQLVKRTDKLASPDSTHCAAAAFDIDASGYYIKDISGGIHPVDHPERDPAKVDEIGQILRSNVSHPVNYVHSHEYRPEIIEALLGVTSYLHERDVINAIVEYEGTSNQCVHIAPNPTVDWGLHDIYREPTPVL